MIRNGKRPSSRLMAEEEETTGKVDRPEGYPNGRGRMGFLFPMNGSGSSSGTPSNGRPTWRSAVEEFRPSSRRSGILPRQFSAAERSGDFLHREAVDALAEKVWKEHQDPADYLKTALHNYEHGLKLIREKTGKRQFLIPAGGVENPEHYLNCLIQEAYRPES